MARPKTVIVGVSAGIAAYKTAQLVRDLGRLGVQVRVIPTPDSLNFVGVKTWQALSGHPVGVDVFDPLLDHIELARQVDAIVVAPATADFLARVAGGFANDLLTTTILASSAPLVLAPAMHTQMWQALPTQENVALLRDRGVKIVGPISGDLASGDHGLGRMADTSEILDATLAALDGQSRVFEGETACRFSESTRILVTAGGTREPIDPVRFLGNRSSGLMGMKIVEQAATMGAHVTLVAANLEVAPPIHPNIEIIQAPTARAIHDEVLSRLANIDCLIMSAAVADFAPIEPLAKKIEKSAADDETLTLVLQRTPDVLKAVCKHPDRPKLVVGFGAQTGSLAEALEKGAAKVRQKGADILAVNLVGDKRGFGQVDTELHLLDSQGVLIDSVNGTKSEVAASLLAVLAQRLD